uniref:CRAL-TRIO domain-containing protein n=1 Tax=viral metagenome TaxID=1070528 RepID=A0A6C0EG16_9ZZZZ
MKYSCPFCALDPLSHSLMEITESNNTLYYYTCPSKAKLYFDVKSILNHYDGVLSEIPENKQWVWVFDSTDFNMKHFLQISVGIELAKLISSKFSGNLQKIIIINPNMYILYVYRLVKPFLNKKLRSIIEMNYECKNIKDVKCSLSK